MALEFEDIELGEASATRYFADREVALTGTIRVVLGKFPNRVVFARVHSETVHLGAHYYDGDVDLEVEVSETVIEGVVSEVLAIADRRGPEPTHGDIY